MKKLAIMAVLATSAMAASAMDVGVRGVHTGDATADMVGVTVGKKFGAIGVEGAFDRSTRGDASVNRWSLLGSYDVAKVYGVAVAAKAGVAHVDPSAGSNGGALLVGVGASYPVTKKVSLVADYAYQRGQDRVSAFNGNNVSAGVKVSF
jgi:outer membrane autotransporter protein